jgi:hypothetical protein
MTLPVLNADALSETDEDPVAFMEKIQHLQVR